jgi:hypothetical protein
LLWPCAREKRTNNDRFLTAVWTVENNPKPLVCTQILACMRFCLVKTEAIWKRVSADMALIRRNNSSTSMIKLRSYLLFELKYGRECLIRYKGAGTGLQLALNKAPCQWKLNKICCNTCVRGIGHGFTLVERIGDIHCQRSPMHKMRCPSEGKYNCSPVKSDVIECK